MPKLILPGQPVRKYDGSIREKDFLLDMDRHIRAQNKAKSKTEDFKLKGVVNNGTLTITKCPIEG